MSYARMPITERISPSQKFKYQYFLPIPEIYFKNHYLPINIRTPNNTSKFNDIYLSNYNTAPSSIVPSTKEIFNFNNYKTEHYTPKHPAYDLRILYNITSDDKLTRHLPTATIESVQKIRERKPSISYRKSPNSFKTVNNKINIFKEPKNPNTRNDYSSTHNDLSKHVIKVSTESINIDINIKKRASATNYRDFKRESQTFSDDKNASLKQKTTQSNLDAIYNMINEVGPNFRQAYNEIVATVGTLRKKQYLNTDKHYYPVKRAKENFKLSTLQHFFENITGNKKKDNHQIYLEVRKQSELGSLEKELDPIKRIKYFTLNSQQIIAGNMTEKTVMDNLKTIILSNTSRTALANNNNYKNHQSSRDLKLIQLSKPSKIISYTKTPMRTKPSTARRMIADKYLNTKIITLSKPKIPSTEWILDVKKSIYAL